MAEVQQQTPRAKGIRARQSTKIDMTPMVDLAFLLLTFFILTSTFGEKKIMELTMPDSKANDSTTLSEKNCLNLLLTKDNDIYWWKGLAAKPSKVDYSNNGLRKLLIEESNNNRQLMVLIKPKDDARYGNLVDVLDEMAIANIQRYAIVNLSEEDQRISAESVK